MPPRSNAKRKTIVRAPDDAPSPAPLSREESAALGSSPNAPVAKAEHLGRYRPPAEWIDEVLRAHNIRRGKHWTPPLVWSDECFEYAKRQADACLEEKAIRNGHVDCMSGRMGQCVLGPPFGPWRVNRPGMAENIVEHWYAQGSHYKYDRPGFRQDAANFFQILWFNTTSVGMALSRDGRYAVANYFPAGHDCLNGPPIEKACRDYFPAATCPAGFPSGPLLYDREEKEKRYFRSNVRPLHKALAPWLGGLPEQQSEEEVDDSPKRSRSNDKRKSSKKNTKGKRSKSLPGLVRAKTTGSMKGPSEAVAAAAAMAMAVGSPKGRSQKKRQTTKL